ncbi:MAG: transglycosylase domain-containing protein [SAR324 cluster bacterium]|nr:transglycosylase domain-containing protein [SAR324 cluster bacterium]
MKRFIFFFTLILSLVTIGSTGYLFHLIFFEPGTHLDISRIRQSVLTESTVYYQDGKRKLGAFYNDAHRDYLVSPHSLSTTTVSDDTIPPLFLRAIVASEDNKFYEHVGISLLGILRAATANLRAGKVVQGGSTLTQQTAELLFEHKATNKWGKWKEKALETLDAFRLEAHYTKNQILEFYTNLFHVHGTGQGLSIAARYYFNKSVSELNLPEIAFIAGSVKGPANYNPFRTTNLKKIETITQKATHRRNYVLNNMLRLGIITQKQYQDSIKNPVQFRRGSFQFEENHQMDAVREVLSSDFWREILQGKGIQNLSQAEINIYTTLDYPLQKYGEFILKRHLSHLEYRITHYTLPIEKPLSRKKQPLNHNFHVGRISQISSKKPRHIKVQLGSDEGIVEEKFIDEFVRNVTRLRPYHKIKTSHYKRAFHYLKKNDPVLVSTHGQLEDGQWLLAIEQRPQLNGGVFILQEGEVRAMIGGFDNSGFNRALHAKRQPGSTFKLPVYLGGLELGWHPLEALPNKRGVYSFQGQFYFPRPDHKPKDTVSSMAWAGTKSENLASIYLLVHLLDHLNLQQFKQLMEFTELSHQNNGESLKEYQTRLRDGFGIIDIERNLYPGIFEVVQNRLKQEYLVGATTSETQAWDQLFYGKDWKKAYNNREVDKAKNSKKKYQEKIERELLQHNYLRFQEIAETMQEKLTILEENFNQADDTSLRKMDETLLNGFYIQPQAAKQTQVPPLSYAIHKKALEPEWSPLTRQNLLLYQRFWNETKRQAFLRPDNIWIENKIRSSMLVTAKDLMGQLLEETKQWKPFTPERLFYHHDFRVTMALQTVIKISKILGVQSELKPILSFPLGANEVTLEELALMYQTYMKGEIFQYPDGPSQNAWKLIDRIEDAKGNILFQNQHSRKRILSEKTTHSLQEILRSVVEYGTGRSVKSLMAIEMDDDNASLVTLRIPAFGKTGTANNYSNATYAGYLPAIKGGHATIKGGYTITSYVGLDRQKNDNQPLPFKLTGASGSLPVWGQIANYLIHQPSYQSKLDWKQLELKEGEEHHVLSLPHPDGVEYQVLLINGLINPEKENSPEKTATVYFPLKNEDTSNSRTVELFKEMTD